MSPHEVRPEKAVIPDEGWQLLSRRNALLPRIALMLTLALLPLGIIAVLQTQNAISSARATYRASLSAQTARLVTPEREAILGAQGIAQGLADALAVLGPSDSVCTDLMRYSAQRNDDIVFLGFIDANRQSECNNRSASIDYSHIRALDGVMQRHELSVSYTPKGEASGKPVLVVRQPVFSAQGVFRGVVTLSMLAEKVVADRAGDPVAKDVVIVSFNDNGEILTTDGAPQNYQDYLPANTKLTDLIGKGRQLFAEVSVGGESRDFAVVPIIEGKAYALGSWQPMRPLIRDRAFSTLTLLFPLLMWLISLVVALVAIRRQVILPIRVLGRQMRDFAEGRRVFHSEMSQSAPSELREIGETFATMAQKVIRDEADIENTIHERDVLIKEVHHRVKNNLQLMSSILNMQARGAPSDDTRDALSKVQDRLTGLAAVHRGLYETPQVSQVRIDLLLEDLLGQLTTLGEGDDVTAALDVDFQFERVTLIPDQAGPLAMLASEAFTNALKYATPGQDGCRHIRVRLHPDPVDPDMIKFEIANTVGDDMRIETEQGLGLKLIQAFCAQLDCRMNRCEEEAGWYELQINFKAQHFEPSHHTPRV